jgi:hypothetical protein
MNMEMPFGRYRGRPLQQVPHGYLRWLRENVKLSPFLAQAVDCVLSGRPIPDDGDLDEQVHRIVRDADFYLRRM